MRVVMNGLAALKPKTGVGHHVAQVANHLAATFPQDSFTLYPGERLGRLVTRFVHRPKPAGPAGSKKQANSLRTTAFTAAKEAGKFASRLHFTVYSRAFNFDLYHEPNFVPFACHLPTVVTVHDLSVVRFPEWHPTDRVRFHDRHFADGLIRAEHVIVVSDAVRRETIDMLGISADRVTTVYNGVNPSFRPQSPEAVTALRHRLELPEKYFLCVGTIEPRKNIGTVLRAFADLPANVREACPLVLAGPWGWKAEADREYFEQTAKPLGARHLGYVADADLPALYAGATALVYPSHYEGFGLPPVEMLACGGAVLASTADAVREVVGRHGQLIDPHDLQGWRDAMHRAATEPAWLAKLKAGGIAHARQFTWDRAARETHIVYRQTLGLPVITSMSAAA